MNNKYYATAVTNENGLVAGKEYIVKSNFNGTVDIHDMNGVYLMTYRIDCFDRFKEAV